LPGTSAANFTPPRSSLLRPNQARCQPKGLLPTLPATAKPNQAPSTKTSRHYHQQGKGAANIQQVHLLPATKRRKVKKELALARLSRRRRSKSLLETYLLSSVRAPRQVKKIIKIVTKRRRTPPATRRATHPLRDNKSNKRDNTASTPLPTRQATPLTEAP
jgi:hypothetical protein